MDSKILLSMFIIGGTLVEIYLLWNPSFFNNEYIKLLASSIVTLDILALLQILLNI
ncbi:MAG: hypothetical protein ACP5GJ_02020 [Nanopusillaceae archaeon]